MFLEIVPLILRVSLSWREGGERKAKLNNAAKEPTRRQPSVGSRNMPLIQAAHLRELAGRAHGYA